MPVYTFQAVTEAGAIEKGQLNAQDELALEKALAKRHLALLRAREGFAAGGSRARIKPRELAELARYVSITCKGGLSLVESLEDFAQQSQLPNVKRVLAEVVKDVRDGLTLSESMARHPRAFDEGVLALTRAGEASGHMDDVMRRLAEQLEFQLEVKSKIKGALIYPCILGTAVIGLIILLITFLLPKIVGMLVQNDVKLPGPTQALLDLSRFITGNWLLLIVGIGSAIAGLKFFARTRTGGVLLNRMLLGIPALGKLAKMGSETRFVATLRTLIVAGVEAVGALEMAAESCGAPYLSSRLRGASVRLREGRTFSEALRETRVVHPLVLRMAQLGERTGKMDESLGTCVDYFSAEVPKAVRKAIALLEPTIICFAGMTVGFILLATLMPVFSMYASV